MAKIDHNIAVYNDIRNLYLSRAKLKQSSQVSALLSGFALVSNLLCYVLKPHLNPIKTNDQRADNSFLSRVFILLSATKLHAICVFQYER